MVELIAGGIILYGTPTGVWSPSHPHMYPMPAQIVVPSLPPGYVPYPEPPFNPGPYTYEDGTPIVL